MKLGLQVGLGPGHIVFDGDPAPPLKGAQQPPTFKIYGHRQRPSSIKSAAHACCGQTTGWMKMLCGTEVGLGPGHILLDGDPAPPKGHSSPLSAHVYCTQTSGWIKMKLGMEVGIGPGHIVLDGHPSPRPPKWHSPFGDGELRPMSVVAKWLDGSRCHLVGR